MSARCWAALCTVLIFGVSNGRAEPVSSPGRRVVVYLQNGSSPEAVRTLPYMQRELEALMQSAGYRVEWKVPGKPSDDKPSDDKPSNEGDGVLAVVELRGSCRVSESAVHMTPVKNGASLAATAVDGDQVLPFSWINCETLTQLLTPTLAGMESEKRDFLYGRAMGRVAAHELYHILANEREHSGSGVGKSSFSAGDILADHFIFEGSALALLNAPDPGTGPASAEESAAGR
jgi:hypothetical protein